MTVRDSVWFTLGLTTVARESPRIAFTFSRTRSKMTIVSFTEYPMMVRSAAVTFSVRS